MINSESLTNMTSLQPHISSISSGPRQTNIELLRILAIFLTLVVHADCWSLGGPTNQEFANHPINAFTRTFFEALSIVCVNVLVLISGWFGIKPSVKGFSSFIFQCAFFLFGIYAVMLVTGYAQLSVKGIAGCLCLTADNWFIKAYIALYILSPLLNKFVETTSKRQLGLILIFFYIFSTIYGWTGRAAFIEYGYSCFSFIGLYLLSAFTRRYISINYKWGGVIYLATIFINTMLYYIACHFHLGHLVWAYANPFVIIGSMGLILWFAHLNISYNKYLNWIAKSSFAVILLHGHPNVCVPIYMVWMINLYETYSGLTYLGIVFVILVLIFIVSILLDQPRKWIWKILSRQLSKYRFYNYKF